jgi:hypothetical protein
VDQFALRGAAQTFGCAAAIGAHQAARAELDSAEPARDDNDDLIQALAVDRLQDRLAGGTGRFAIVVESIVLARRDRPSSCAWRRLSATAVTNAIAASGVGALAAFARNLLLRTSCGSCAGAASVLRGLLI